MYQQSASMEETQEGGRKNKKQGGQEGARVQAIEGFIQRGVDWYCLEQG
jgi:hypothetical protein